MTRGKGGRVSPKTWLAASIDRGDGIPQEAWLEASNNKTFQKGRSVALERNLRISILPKGYFGMQTEIARDQTTKPSN